MRYWLLLLGLMLLPAKGWAQATTCPFGLPCYPSAGGSPTSPSVVSQAPFTGSSSRAVITGSVAVVISATSRQVLSYEVSGATTDYACAVWASSAPTFTVNNSGGSTDCGVAGSFVIGGTYRYGPSTPPLSSQALYAQSIGSISDTFAVSAQW